MNLLDTILATASRSHARPQFGCEDQTLPRSPAAMH